VPKHIVNDSPILQNNGAGKNSHGASHSKRDSDEPGFFPAQSSPVPSQSNTSLWQAVIASTPDTMIILDENFSIVDCNPAASEVVALTRHEMMGHSCRKVLKCRNLSKTSLCGTSSCPLARVFEQGKSIPNEELIIGETCEVSMSLTLIDDASSSRKAALIARDISALQVANRVRANFVSMVSHELRTPLNSVHGFIDLLLQGHMGALNAEQQTYLGYSQEGVQQLISIVEDILFLSSSDAGQFEIRPQEVNFHVLARHVISSMEPQARKAEVSLHKDIPSPTPLLYADPQRMKQVLTNLVANSIKFTPPGGTVTIHAHPYNDRFVMVSVSDTGYGIPIEDRSHIFDRFYQSNHSQQSKMGGYGLGLSIAKLIVEQHGGTISFESVLNKGTTFYFTAPLHENSKQR
jgi:PAS domain S-box-containing protein